MEYADIPFPGRIKFGAMSAPEWRTGVTVMASGFEARDSQWADAQHKFDIGYAVRTISDYRAVKDHFHSVRGRRLAFPFKDHTDFEDEDRGELDETTDGWQMLKRYGYDGFEWFRVIQKPVEDSVTIWRTRSGNTVDISAQATVDYDTGLVDIEPAAIEEGDTFAWRGEFWVPCRYGIDSLPTVIVNREPENNEYLVTCDSIPIVEVRLRLESSS